MSSDLTLRPATGADLPRTADLYLRVREAAVPAMPPVVHTADEVRRHVAGWDLHEHDVWVAETDRLVGFLHLTPTWLDALYVDPAAQRAGVGSALLGVAKSLRPGGFGLWVFVSNAPAREFYRRHGLIELEHTDGRENEERAPDLRMLWPGTHPLEAIRQQIDEVDQELAAVLNRRLALTAAAQLHKPVGGSAGRDAERERSIAERMAARVPRLGVDRLARIMHTVIAESLDAHEQTDRVGPVDRARSPGECQTESHGDPPH